MPTPAIDHKPPDQNLFDMQMFHKVKGNTCSSAMFPLQCQVLAPVADGDPLPTFCFETTCQERFQNVAHLMRLDPKTLESEYVAWVQYMDVCGIAAG